MTELKQKLNQKVTNIREKETKELPFGADLDEEYVVDAMEQERADVKLLNDDINVTTGVPDLAVDIAVAKNRILQLQAFIKQMMVPGIDYGFVQGVPKPMLFKAGAEKLCDIYGFSKHIEVTERVEDWNSGFFHYEIKVSLYNKKSGVIEAEGVGSCNSREKKFSKLDAYSAVNSIIKMAKKRALVDATLTATRTSGVFGQDLEQNVA